MTVIVSASLSHVALSTASQSKSTSAPSRLTTSSVVAVATVQRPSFNSAAASAVMGFRSPGAGGRAWVTQSGTEIARRRDILQRYGFSDVLDEIGRASCRGRADA